MEFEMVVKRIYLKDLHRMMDGMSIGLSVVHKGQEDMTQDEKWLAKYDEVVGFIKKNHRNPSKYVDEERGLVNWCKHQRKIINAGEMKPERIEMFEKLLELVEKYKRINQYQ